MFFALTTFRVFRVSRVSHCLSLERIDRLASPDPLRSLALLLAAALVLAITRSLGALSLCCLDHPLLFRTGDAGHPIVVIITPSKRDQLTSRYLLASALSRTPCAHSSLFPPFPLNVLHQVPRVVPGRDSRVRLCIKPDSILTEADPLRSCCGEGYLLGILPFARGPLMV